MSSSVTSTSGGIALGARAASLAVCTSSASAAVVRESPISIPAAGFWSRTLLNQNCPVLQPARQPCRHSYCAHVGQLDVTYQFAPLRCQHLWPNQHSAQLQRRGELRYHARAADRCASALRHRLPARRTTPIAYLTPRSPASRRRRQVSACCAALEFLPISNFCSSTIVNLWPCNRCTQHQYTASPICISNNSSCWHAGPPGVDPADNDGQPRTVWQRVKRFFGGDKLDRQQLAALGLGAVASYGAVSNVTYGWV